LLAAVIQSLPQALAASPAAQAPRPSAAVTRPASAASAASAATAGGLDPFARRSWLAPPPPPPKPVAAPAPAPEPPPPPPTAPPLPFVLLGLMEPEPGQTTVLLTQGSELIVARAGDEIAGRRYRVVTITPTAIHFLYLPLQQAQVLQVPGGAP
jgi:hypothetical protein